MYPCNLNTDADVTSTCVGRRRGWGPTSLMDWVHFAEKMMIRLSVQEALDRHWQDLVYAYAISAADQC